MIALPYVDFVDCKPDPDRSREVVEIYRNQFPDLYTAYDSGELRTSTGSPIKLGGDTLITYWSAIEKIYKDWH